MGFVVKNTIVRWLWDMICPDICCSCGEVGTNLCECCKKYINRVEKEKVEKCLEIERKDEKQMKKGLIVKKREKKLTGLAVVGYREGIWAELIHKYKYGCRRGMAEELAEMMVKALEEIKKEWKMTKKVVVVPLPTIDRHIRERGFDHTRLLAEKVAKMEGWEEKKLLKRRENTVQVGVDAEKRRKQAKKAYKMAISGALDGGVSYLLVDDVWTTGASMEAAARVLRRAGARKIYGVVLAVGR